MASLMFNVSPVEDVVALISDVNTDPRINTSSVTLSSVTAIADEGFNSSVDVTGNFVKGLDGKVTVKYNRLSLPALLPSSELSGAVIDVNVAGGATLTTKDLLEHVRRVTGINLTTAATYADLESRNYVFAAKDAISKFSFGPGTKGSLRLLPGDITLRFRAIGVDINSNIAKPNVDSGSSQNLVSDDGKTTITVGDKPSVQALLYNTDFSQWLANSVISDNVDNVECKLDGVVQDTAFAFNEETRLAISEVLVARGLPPVPVGTWLVRSNRGAKWSDSTWYFANCMMLNTGQVASRFTHFFALCTPRGGGYVAFRNTMPIYPERDNLDLTYNGGLATMGPLLGFIA